MKRNSLVLTIFILFGLCACGGGGIFGETDSTDVEANYQRIREKMEEAEAEGKAQRAQRNEKGDTLALTPETLKSYLPKRFDGYRALDSGFVGTPYQLSGASYSSVSQDYQKEGSFLKITLDDYNGKESDFASSVKLWTTGLRVDDQRTRAGSVKIAEHWGWEIYDKRTKKAELMLAISDRLLLSLIASNQENTDFIKEVAESLDLDELSDF